jgi:4-hydroxy-tetrahydrodipicolinate synthase
VPFVAGAYIENPSGADTGDAAGDVVALYRREMERIAALGGIPILFQTARLHGKSAEEKAAAHRAICRGFPRVLAFELGPMFAPNGEIFDEETVRRRWIFPSLWA